MPKEVQEFVSQHGPISKRLSELSETGEEKRVREELVVQLFMAKQILCQLKKLWRQVTAIAKSNKTGHEFTDRRQRRRRIAKNAIDGVQAEIVDELVLLGQREKIAEMMVDERMIIQEEVPLIFVRNKNENMEFHVDLKRDIT